MTHITIRIEDSTTSRALPPSKDVRRRTVNVPRSDTSVDTWWDAQHNPSTSVRRLIREYIEAHGYEDIDTGRVVPRQTEPALVTTTTPVIVVDKTTGEADHYTLGDLSIHDPQERQILEAVMAAGALQS